MGALNILDRNVQPDFNLGCPDICQGGPRIPPNRNIGSFQEGRPTIDGNKGQLSGTWTRLPSASWTHKVYKRLWPKKNESGSSQSSQPSPLPTSAYAKYGKRDLDKTEEQIFKQQKMAGQVLVAIKNRCKQQVLDHADLILNAPGATPRTKLIAFVKFIESRRLCDLTVVSIVQDDIKGLNPISTFPDAVDNIIAINLLQEELTLMGQPYSDADLIVQHTNAQTHKRTNAQTHKHKESNFLLKKSG